MLSSSRVWVCLGGPPSSEKVRTVSWPLVEPALAFRSGWPGASPRLASRMYAVPVGMLVVIVAPGLLSGVDRVRVGGVGVLMRSGRGGWWSGWQQQGRDDRGRGEPGGDPERGAECVSQRAGQVQVLPVRQCRDPREVAKLAGRAGRDGALQEDGKQGGADRA